MTNSDRVLYLGKNFRLEASFETVYLFSLEGREEKLGWMYGDPEQGLVTWDEQYAVIIGAGIIIAKLNSPNTTDSTTLTQSIVHLNGEPANLMFYEAVYQIVFTKVRLVADPLSVYGGIYDLDLHTLEISQIFSNPTIKAN